MRIVAAEVAAGLEDCALEPLPWLPELVVVVTAGGDPEGEGSRTGRAVVKLRMWNMAEDIS